MSATRARCDFHPLAPKASAEFPASRIALIGAGALGTVSAELLARAGAGFIRIVDRDFVESSNLQRQSLYDEEDVRRNLPKSEAAAAKLRRINSGIQIESVVDDVNPSNVEDYIQRRRPGPRCSRQLRNPLRSERCLRQTLPGMDLCRSCRKLWSRDANHARKVALPALHAGKLACARHVANLRYRRRHRVHHPHRCLDPGRGSSQAGLPHGGTA